MLPGVWCTQRRMGCRSLCYRLCDHCQDNQPVILLFAETVQQPGALQLGLTGGPILHGALGAGPALRQHHEGRQYCSRREPTAAPRAAVCAPDPCQPIPAQRQPRRPIRCLPLVPPLGPRSPAHSACRALSPQPGRVPRAARCCRLPSCSG